MLSNIKDKVHTLLACDSTDEGKEWNTVINILEVEVFLLEFLLGSEMVWGYLIKLSSSLSNRDTIGESEWLGFLTQEPAERGAVKEIISVRFTDGGPLIT